MGEVRMTFEGLFVHFIGPTLLALNKLLIKAWPIKPYVQYSQKLIFRKIPNFRMPNYFHFVEQNEARIKPKDLGPDPSYTTNNHLYSFQIIGSK